MRLGDGRFPLVKSGRVGKAGVLVGCCAGRVDAAGGGAWWRRLRGG